MADKKTQREYFNEIMAIVKDAGRDDLVEFVKGRVALLDKKSANRKQTKTQKANEDIKDIIFDVLAENGGAMTVTEILASGKFEESFSNQKISALLKQMVDAEVVDKVVDKKVSRFKIATATDVDVEVEEVAE